MELSILEKEIINKIDDNSIKVVSFDIFDTLMFRKCQLPSTIFKIVGENSVVKDIYDTAENFQKYRIYAEENARKKHTQHQDITLEQIYNELALTDDLRKQFQALELETEKEYLVPNNDLDRIIEQAAAKGKRVILISDMYLNSEQLHKTCLYKLKNIDKVSKLYVSSEYKVTKSKGDLFNEVLKEENINPEQLLHIGDNSISDVLRANELNINSIYYGLKEHALVADEYERAYIKEQIEQGCHIRKVAALRDPFQDDFRSFYYNFGASVLGPALYEFSHWLYEQGSKHGVEEYSFFMREGYTFEKFFRMLYPTAKTNLIFASRASTSAIEMDEEDDLVSIMLGTHKKFAIKDLFNSLKIQNNNELLIKYKNTQVYEANYVNIDNMNLSELLVEELTKRKYEIYAAIEKEQKLIQSYFESHGVDKSHMLVDFGAGGTIFTRVKKNLSDKTPAHNALFYINERGFKQQSESHVLSFLPYNLETSAMIESIARSPELYEILLNLDQATTVGYIKKDGIPSPITYVPNCNRSTILTIKSSFLLGIMAFYNAASEYDIQTSTFDRVYITKLLARVINLPTTYEVSFFKNLEIDEGKGSTHIYKITNKSQSEIIKGKHPAEMYIDFMSNPQRYRYSFPWFELSFTDVYPKFLFNRYKNLYAGNPNIEAINIIISKIEKFQVKEFMVFGAGVLFKELLPYLEDIGIKVFKVIDSRAEIEEFYTQGYHVTSLEKAFNNIESANIIIASNVFVDQIKDKINKFAILNKKSIKIFSIK